MVNYVRTAAELGREVQKAGNKLVVVDFTATWCGPCQMIAPYFEQFAGQYKDVVFLKVDYNQGTELVNMYGVRSVPTFLFFKNNKTIDTLTGADIEGVRRRIQQYK